MLSNTEQHSMIEFELRVAMYKILELLTPPHDDGNRPNLIRSVKFDAPQLHYTNIEPTQRGEVAV